MSSKSPKPMEPVAPAVYVCADVHIGTHRLLGGAMTAGVNRRCREGLAALNAACKLAARGGGCLVIAGDLSDVPKPSPQVLRAIMDALAPAAKLTDDGEPGVVIVAGNHDRTTDAPGDNALAPLACLEGVLIVDSPMRIQLRGRTFALLPAVPRGSSAKEWVAERAAACAQKGGADVLVLHAGVEDELTEHFLKGSRGSIHVLDLAAAAKVMGATEVYAGDWHDHKVRGLEGVRIVQCGALVPTGWDNPGTEYGKVVEVGSNRVWAIPGPRFLTAATVADAEVKMRHEFVAAGTREVRYVKVAVPPAEFEAALARLAAVEAERQGWAHALVVAAGTQTTKATPGALSAGVSVEEALSKTADAAWPQLDDDARAERVAKALELYKAAEV